MAAPRTILHVDMDAFFASVEQRDDPALRGRPVLVGGRGRRGVVAAASYEAREFGCHSALPMAVARRRCPEAVIVAPRGAAYREASEQVFAIFRESTPLVEPLSIDEAFLDVTACKRLAGGGREIAEGIRARIAHALRLTASVGIAPNKFLAKLASDMNKPDGLTEIPAERAEEILRPMPIRRVPGIGPAAEKRLTRLGIQRIGDARDLGLERLVAQLGPSGAWLFALSCGQDERPVVPDSVAKSISQECTFAVDVSSREGVRAALVAHVESVARRVRRGGRVAGVVQLKLRFGDFQTITRSRTLPEPSDATDTLLEVAGQLFHAWATEGFQPVRLIGFGASGLKPVDPQLRLFPDPAAERNRRLDRTVDALRDRYGPASIGRATGSLQDLGRADGFEHEEGPDRKDSDFRRG